MHSRCTSRTFSDPMEKRCSRNPSSKTTTSAAVRPAEAMRPSPRRPIRTKGDLVGMNVGSTQLIPRPGWENPRVHLLSDIWLLTIVVILTATGVPWFASGFEVDVGAASWGLLALGAVHVAFTILASPSRAHGKWRDRALTLLDILGVVLIGFVWQHVGALQNPMFLTVFALPVIGAIFLSRWHPYLIATISVLLVAGVALSQAP